MLPYLLWLLLALAGPAFSSPSSKAPMKIPTFEINLDKPPRERYTEVIKRYKTQMEAQGRDNRAEMLQMLGDNKAAWEKLADESFDEEATEEIAGIVDLLDGRGLPLKERLYEMKLTQMLYELSWGVTCSGVLFADKAGKVIHGRNIDYGEAFYWKNSTGRVKLGNLKDMTFNGLYTKGGKPLFIQSMWPGQIIVHTGMSYAGWSFEQNTRATNNRDENLAAGQKGGKLWGMVARRLLERPDVDFKTAVKKLATEKMMSPSYFIMAGKGPYEGAVITTDRLGKHEKETPPLRRLSQDTWSTVQTNDDWGHPTMDNRRPWAVGTLKWMQQDTVSVPGMWEVIRSAPLYEAGWNQFATVMVPATNYYETAHPDATVQQIESSLLHGDSLTSHKVHLLTKVEGEELVEKKKKQEQSMALPIRHGVNRQSKTKHTLSPGLTISDDSDFDDASTRKVRTSRSKLRGAVPDDVSSFIQLLLDAAGHRKEL